MSLVKLPRHLYAVCVLAYLHVHVQYMHGIVSILNCLLVPLQGQEERIDDNIREEVMREEEGVEQESEVVGEVSDDGSVDVDPPTPPCSGDPLFTFEIPTTVQSAEFSGSNGIF